MAKTPQQREKIRQARVTARTAEQNPLVTPPVAAVFSLVLPGLGHVLSRQTQRGVLILSAIATSVMIFAWRISELGRRVDGFFPTIQRALERRPIFVGLVAVALALVWLVAAWDAFLCSRERQRPTTGIFALVLASFFVLGWQIAEIDIVKLVREAPEALPPLSRVMWPWSAAITYDTESLTAGAEGSCRRGHASGTTGTGRRVSRTFWWSPTWGKCPPRMKTTNPYRARELP